MNPIVSTIVLTIIGLLPSAAWLFFYLSRDRKPEPRRLLLLVFFFGFLTVPIAGLLEVQFNCWFGYDHNNICVLGSAARPIVGGIASLLLIFGFGALVEELLKFMAVRLSVWKHKAFDEPIDAMIYMIVAALGFAAAENIGNAWGLAQAANAPLSISAIFDGTHPVIQLMTLRFFGATLLHTLTSGIMGYFSALRRFRFKNCTQARCRGLVGRGLFYAIVIHALFNIFVKQWQLLDSLGYMAGVLALLIGGLIIILRDVHTLNTRV